MENTLKKTRPDVQFRHYPDLGLSLAGQIIKKLSGDYIHIAMAICAKGDKFSRPKGRTIALGRLNYNGEYRRSMGEFVKSFPAADYADQYGSILWKEVLKTIETKEIVVMEPVYVTVAVGFSYQV